MMTLLVFMEVTIEHASYIHIYIQFWSRIWRLISLFLDFISLGNANDQCPDNNENEKLFISRNGYKDSKGSTVFDKSMLDDDLSCLTTVFVLSVNQKPSDGDEKTEICM